MGRCVFRHPEGEDFGQLHRRFSCLYHLMNHIFHSRGANIVFLQKNCFMHTSYHNINQEPMRQSINTAIQDL